MNLWLAAQDEFGKEGEFTQEQSDILIKCDFGPAIIKGINDFAEETNVKVYKQFCQ
jgi:hypothetical protein